MINIKNVDGSGIYRIWVIHNNEEYSYIGTSINIKERVKSYLTDIRGFLRNSETKGRPKFTKGLEKERPIPHNKLKIAFKISFFLGFNNLRLSNLNYDLLEKIDIKYFTLNKISVEEKQIKYMTKYNSEWKGFNDILEKLLKYALWSRGGYYKKVISKGESKASFEMFEKEKQRHRDLINRNMHLKITPMSWVFYNYQTVFDYADMHYSRDVDIIPEDNWDDIDDGIKYWNQDCELILKKIKNYNGSFEHLIDA